jgi:hypothetical protein
MTPIRKRAHGAQKVLSDLPSSLYRRFRLSLTSPRLSPQPFSFHLLAAAKLGVSHSGQCPSYQPGWGRVKSCLGVTVNLSPHSRRSAATGTQLPDAGRSHGHNQK